MTTYQFQCQETHKEFNAEASRVEQSLLLGILTLGFIRHFALYFHSRSPYTGKRNWQLLILPIILLLLTAEFCRELYYFVQYAPQQIIREASSAELPEGMQYDSPVQTEDLPAIVSFVWKIGLLPYIGGFITTQWPYIVLAWCTVILLINFSFPSIYTKPG